ncbi:MAG TPA: HEAT repeat domain-containing protein [Gemmataceae bacterium]|nr:HEAT repeat domain-containing protein [Gemmataceae bacterium]
MNRHVPRFARWFAALAALLATSFPPAAPAEPSIADDEQALRSAGFSTDGPALLAIIRKHTLTPEARKNVDGLIGRLGADSFAERENASKELFALGSVALPQLQEASKHEDPEIARRARFLIERIEQSPTQYLPVAAIRMLAVRKPPGVVAALLAYVPSAEDESRIDEVRKSLTALAQRDGKPNPILMRTLSDNRPALRIMAAQSLAAGGGTAGRSEVRKLLKDDAPMVRLRVALALALAKEREVIPVLIDLLAVLPAEPVGEVESVLYQLAGDSAPKMPAGTEPADREKCRAAWTAWWKLHADHIDLTRLAVRPQLGFTLLCDTGKNCLYEVDLHGKQRWKIENVQGPVDAVVLPGNRVLIAEYHGSRVTERDLKGAILWQKQVATPVAVQRLPNGNTFIASDQGPFREVNRAGKDIYVIQNVPNGVRSAYRLPRGPIVCLTQKGECVLIDTAGKRLRSFDTNHVFSDVAGMDLATNGRILVAQDRRNKVVEYDAQGKKLLEVAAPQVGTATALPNGHILAASYQGHRVYELDRAGKVVWEYKNAGHAWRARRR